MYSGFVVTPSATRHYGSTATLGVSVVQQQAPGTDSLPAARACAAAGSGARRAGRAGGGARRGAGRGVRGCDASIAPRCTVTRWHKHAGGT